MVRSPVAQRILENTSPETEKFVRRYADLVTEMNLKFKGIKSTDEIGQLIQDQLKKEFPERFQENTELGKGIEG